MPSDSWELLDDAEEPLAGLEAAVDQALDWDASSLVPVDSETPEADLAAELNLPDAYRQPWDRLPDETPAAWKAFQIYRDMGTARTMVGVAKQLGHHPMTVQKRAKKFDWANRVRLMDEHDDRLYQLERVHAIREMADRHGEQIVEMVDALLVPFKAIMLRLEQDPDAVQDLSEKQFSKLIDMATRAGRLVPGLMNAERLARGMPTEIVETQHTGTVTHEWDRDQLGEIYATLQSAGAFDGHQRKGLGESGSDEYGDFGFDAVDAEIVDAEFEDSDTDRLDGRSSDSVPSEGAEAETVEILAD